MTCDLPQNRKYGPSRRVLMITCAFPPTGGPGVQRSVKFVKYLPSFGWDPVVWAAEPLEGLPRDATLLADVPAEVPVLRLRAEQATVSWVADGSLAYGVVLRGREWVRDAIRQWRTRLLLPDDQIGWARRSVRPLRGLVGEEHIKVIYSTYSPPSNHWLALRLKESTGLPWVADFRDLWTDDYRYQERSRRRRAAHRALEQTILESADAVIGVTERQTEILASHVPEQADKFHTITNGVDPADFAVSDDRSRAAGALEAGGAPLARHGRFLIAHVGRLDRRRTPDAFFGGLHRFVRNAGLGPRDAVLAVVGHASREVVERVRACGLGCDFAGYVTHARAISAMRGADVLLLPIPEGPNAESVIPAKLFEYLAARRPILVLGPTNGEAARVVREAGAGQAVEFGADATADALLHCYQRRRDGVVDGGCNAVQLDRFSRVRLTQRLAGLFDELTGVAAAHGVERDVANAGLGPSPAQLAVVSGECRKIGMS